MARENNKLTPAELLSFTEPGRYSDGGGLYLQISPGGGRSWLFRYQLEGKSRWMGLGPVDVGRLADSLAEARSKAADARGRLSSGLDPLAAKRAEAAALVPQKAATFEECARDYISANEPSWRNSVHRRQWRSTLATYVYPIIGKMPVAGVDIDNVKRILEPLWRSKPETARRVRGRIEAVLDYAAAHKYRAGENPARMQIVKQLLGKGRPKVAHHPALPWQQMPDLMRKIEGRKDIPALALQWLILTATRSSEARGATWDEIDQAKGVWVIPASRMKTGVEHRVPLSLLALDVLGRMVKREGSPYVFWGQGSDPISETSLRNVLRGLGIDRHTATLHGFRSTFRDWAAENKVDDAVAEACLAHVVSDKVVAAYRRTTFFAERAKVMLTWGLYLC